MPTASDFSKLILGPEAAGGLDPASSLLTRYYGGLRAAAAVAEESRPTTRSDGFSPALVPPPFDDRLACLFAPATAAVVALTGLGADGLSVLDLTRDAETRTTKTFASLMMVARALDHIRRTGERILILVTTSGNKGQALRRSVAHAYACGLCTPDQLRVLMVAPAASAPKLRRSALSDTAALAAANPLVLFDGGAPEAVKAVGQRFVARYADQVEQRFGLKIWFTFDAINYVAVDAVRAFFEFELMRELGAPLARYQAHAISSAFGLLGYHLGRRVLRMAGLASDQVEPGYIVVQQLARPDVVVHLRHGDFVPDGVPAYTVCPQTGFLCQDRDPHFPSKTFAADEFIDATFYARTPATAAPMTALIRDHGGTGLVVSLAECLERYPLIRRQLTATGIELPEDPRQLAEWATVMVMTGVLNARARGLVEEKAPVLVHASGSCRTDEVSPIAPDSLPRIGGPEAVDQLYAMLAANA